MVLVPLPRTGTAQFKIPVQVRKSLSYAAEHICCVRASGIQLFGGGGVCLCFGHAVAQFVQAVRYKPESSGVRFPMVSLEFFIDIILPAAQWP